MKGFFFQFSFTKSANFSSYGVLFGSLENLVGRFCFKEKMPAKAFVQEDVSHYAYSQNA